MPLGDHSSEGFNNARFDLSLGVTSVDAISAPADLVAVRDELRPAHVKHVAHDLCFELLGPIAHFLVPRRWVIHRYVSLKVTAAEVYQSATGSVRVKMHDKPAALEKLARALGMFKDRVDITNDGKPVAPVLIISSYPEPESAPAASGRARDADGRAPPSKLER